MSSKKQKNAVTKASGSMAPTHAGDVLNDVRELIEQARERVAQQVAVDNCLEWLCHGHRQSSASSWKSG